MSEPKITVLPYAGPEVMGNEWGIEAKPSGARVKSNGGWKNYYNPEGAYGKRPDKKKEEQK